MNVENAKLFMQFLGVHNGESHGEWYRASCPLAFHRHKGGKDAHPSFGLFLNPTGRSGYSCFSCGLKSRDLADVILEIQYALQQKSPHSAPPMELEKALVLAEKENELGYFEAEWTGLVLPTSQLLEEFPSWWLESFKPVGLFPAGVDYLLGRGVSIKVQKALDIRFDAMKKTVCWPMYDQIGRFSGLRGRYIAPKTEVKSHDYKWNGTSNASLVLLNEGRIDETKPIIVVEGEIDMSRVYAVYRNVVSNLSASLTDAKCKKMEKAMHVFGLFDDDEAGEIATQTLASRLGASFTRIPWPDPPMLKQFEPGKGKSVKDPGDCTNEQLVQLIANYVPVDVCL